MIAKKSFKRGDTLFTEEPIFTWDGSAIEQVSLFQQLCMKKHNNASLLDPKLILQLYCIDKHPQDFLPLLKKELPPSLKLSHTNIEELDRLLRIIKVNSMCANGANLVCLTAAMLSHSCAANSQYSYGDGKLYLFSLLYIFSYSLTTKSFMCSGSN